MVADAGTDLLKQLQDAQTTGTPKTQPSQSPSTNANAAATPTPDTVVELKKDFQAIDSFVGTYEGFGFKPLSSDQLQGFLWSTGIWTRPWPDDNGKYGWGGFKLTKTFEDGSEIARWQVQSGREWWESRKHNIVTIVGWAVMVMLLSVGAPFWQDALESLFGIKNLLRQKSGTQNIESQSGTGQPKE
jgi:hypothetical protein